MREWVGCTGGILDGKYGFTHPIRVDFRAMRRREEGVPETEDGGDLDDQNQRDFRLKLFAPDVGVGSSV